MNNLGNSTISTLALPTGITNARDCEYVVYSSLAGSIGHRLVYYNSSDPNGSFTQYDNPSENDYLEIIIQGAVASTAVFQFEVAY